MGDSAAGSFARTYISRRDEAQWKEEEEEFVNSISRERDIFEVMKVPDAWTNAGEETAC